MSEQIASAPGVTCTRCGYPLTVSPERFFAIRRVDGEPIGDFDWVQAVSPDDWAWVEESESYDAAQYEMVEMLVRPVERRWFGQHEFRPADASWRECEDCNNDRESAAHLPVPVPEPSEGA